jgi:hypothetical protein
MRSFWVFTFLILFGFTQVGEAQLLVFKKTPVVFFSKANNHFHVISNDTLFSSYGLGHPWKVNKIHYQEGIDYNTLRSDFIPISNTKGDFFVVSGCGLVYELKGDSILRIDHSFRHKNQHSSVIWTQNDTIFMTGGYGFFESTNITTYFDWDTHGWYHHKCRGVEPPDFSGGFSFRGKVAKFFFKGKSEGINGIRDLDEVRVLNTKTWEWQNLGSLELTWNPHNEYLLKFWKNDGRLARLGNKLLHVDVDQNSVTVYSSDKFTSLYELIERGEQLLLSRVNHDQNSFLVELVSRKDYLGVPMAQEIFVHKGAPNWILISIVLTLMVIVLIGWFGWRFRSEGHKLDSPEQLEVQRIEPLTELERRLMIYFFEVGESGFESTDLNRFFDYGDPNFETLKKRKDLKMRELKKKLSLITGISADEVFLEKRLESDRRIKKLYLNPEIKRENEGISL